MHPLKKTYYHLTAHIPRKLPTSEAEFMHMAKVLFEAYKVKDAPNSWAMMAGVIKSTKGNKLRIPWSHIANSCKRLDINALAQCYYVAGMEENLAKIKKIAEEEIAREGQKAGLENQNETPLA